MNDDVIMMDELQTAVLMCKFDEFLGFSPISQCERCPSYHFPALPKGPQRLPLPLVFVFLLLLAPLTALSATTTRSTTASFLTSAHRHFVCSHRRLLRRAITSMSDGE